MAELPLKLDVSETGLTPPPELPGWAIRSREASTNALEDFATEAPEPDTSRPAITASSKRSVVSLAALKAAGIQFDGDEAIAIGQALCRAFITAQLLRRINPDPQTTSVSSPVTAETVLIDATGHVDVNVTDPLDVPAAIQSVGKILSDILPSHLRMFLQSKMIASPPQFETLDELSQALAAYAQPDGRELIQSVYKRGQKGEVATTEVTTEIAPETTPTPSTPDSKPAAPIPSRHHTATVSGALIVAAIAMIGVSGWFLISRSLAEKSTVALLQARPIAPVTGAQVPEPTPALLHEKGSFGDSQNPAAPLRSVARAERPAVSDPPILRATRQPPSATAPPLAGRAEVDATFFSRTTGDRPRSNGSVGIANNSATAAPASNLPARLRPVGRPLPRPTVIPQTIYGKDDPDVTPPIPILMRLLAALNPSSPGVRLDALTIAVVVSADGKADSVKAMNAPQNMGEYVLLSGALSVVKSWEFKPGTKDGAPVRYRLIVPLRALTRPGP